jgi:hypothetical protein
MIRKKNKSARNKIMAKLQKFAMSKQSSAPIGQTDEQLRSKLVDVEKMRDNELARFVVTLMQFQR